MKNWLRIIIVLLKILNSVFTQYTDQILFDERKLVDSEQIRKKITYSKEISKKQYTFWGWFKISKDYNQNTNLFLIKNLNKKEVVDENGNNVVTYEKKENILSINFKKADSNYLFSFNFRDNTETNNFFVKEIPSELTFDSWNYLAVTVNEKSKNRIFIDNFNGTKKNVLSVNKIIIDYEINDNLEITLAEDHITSPDLFLNFSDTFGYFTFCNFALKNLDSLWIYYIKEKVLSYNAILYNFIFDLYEVKEKLQSRGRFFLETEIKNSYIPIYKLNNNKIGLKAKINNEFTVPKVDFSNTENIKSYIFYFHLKFIGDFPKKFNLITRGNQGKSGFLQIEIISDEKKKNIRLKSKGLNQEIIWESTWDYSNNKEYIFFIGIAISPSNTVKLVYQDNLHRSSHVNLASDFFFSNDLQDITYLKDNKNFYKSYLEFYKFMILNSAISPMFYKFKSESDLEINNNNCIFSQNGFKNNNECFYCKNSILSIKNKCEDYCQAQEKNSGSGFCVPCKNPDCSEKPNTKFEVITNDLDTIKLKSTKKIVNPNFTLKNIFKILLDDKNSKDGFFDYDYEYGNIDNQYLNYHFNFKRELKNQKLYFIFKEKNLTLYDENKNLVSTEPIEVEISYFCFVKKTPKLIMKILAYISQIGFYVCLVSLILISIFFKSKMKDLVTFWKYILMMWIKLQVISVSYLFGINMPCTSGVFFSTLYDFNIKWHHNIFENFFDNHHYLFLLDKNQPINGAYQKEGIQAYFLENLFLVLIFHLIIVFLFGILKITLLFNKKKFLRNFLDHFEFTGLFIFFLIFGFPVFYFSAMTLNHTSFSHFSFALSFVVSLSYLFVFLFFIGFFYFKLYKTKYFENKRNKKRFFFFFAGYRNIKKIHSFDVRIFFTQFLIALTAAFFYKKPLIQTIVIFLLQLILIYLAKTYAPWVYGLINLNELISLILGAIGTIFAITVASRQNSSDPFKGDREGFYAFTIVITTFCSIIISYFTYFYFIFCMRWKKEKFKEIEIPKNPFVRGARVKNSKDKIQAKLGKKNSLKTPSFKDFKNDKEEESFNNNQKIIPEDDLTAIKEKTRREDKEDEKENTKNIHDNNNKTDNNEEIELKKNKEKTPEKITKLNNVSIHKSESKLSDNKIYNTPPINSENSFEPKKKDYDFSDNSDNLDIIIPDSNINKKVNFESTPAQEKKHIKLQNYVIEDIDIDDIINN